MPRRDRALKRKRTTQQRFHDALDVAKLVTMGFSPAEIMEILNATRPYTLSERQIEYDIALVKRTWPELARQPRDVLVGRELAKLELIEKEAWRAYCALAVQTRVPDSKSEQFSVISLAERDELLKPRADAWRFLQIVGNCIDRRAKLLGLDAPDRSVHMQMDIREVAREMLQQHAHEFASQEEMERALDAIVRDAEYALGLMEGGAG